MTAGVITDIFQTVVITIQTVVLLYIVLRFDQAIRGAAQGLRANIAQMDEFRVEMRMECDRMWRRIERIEEDVNKANRRGGA